jgi:RNA polymerase sigma factor (sigma-70 family)
MKCCLFNNEKSREEMRQKQLMRKAFIKLSSNILMTRGKIGVSLLCQELSVSLDKVVLKQVIEDWTEDYTEQDKARLLLALKGLKEQQLQLIEMRFFEKRSFKEIGEICGLSENNAKVKTFRAVLKLKEFFHQKE